MHVEYVADPTYAVREIRLRPEEYAGCGRRSAPISRSTRAAGRSGSPSRLRTLRMLSTERRQGECVPHLQHGRRDWLRLAGVKSSIWPPFVNGSSGVIGGLNATA